MANLVAAVSVIGTGCLCNLLLTLVLIHRVRQLTTGAPAASFRPARPGLPAGAPVPDFAVRAVTGKLVTRDSLSGAIWLVGFFDSSCDPCRRQMPEFIQFAREIPGGSERVLAVVSGNGEDSQEFIRELGDVAVVASQPRDGAILAAFAVKAFPNFYLVNEDSRVESGGVAVRMLKNLVQQS